MLKIDITTLIKIYNNHLQEEMFCVEYILNITYAYETEEKRQLYYVTPMKCFWNLFCQLNFLEVFLYSIYRTLRIIKLVHTPS
jgi:hypothetical protein